LNSTGGKFSNLGVIASVPFFSQSDNVNADSDYVYSRAVLREMERQTDNTLFLFFFPDPKYGSDRWKYTPDGLQTDRVRFIPWPYDTQMRASIMGFFPQRFAHIESEMGPMIYWLNQMEMGISMFGGYGQSYNLPARPTIVAQHHYIIHESLPYPLEHLLPRLWLQIGGSLAADLNVFNSEHAHRMARESFSKFLVADKMKEIEEKSVTLLYGLVDGTEPIAPPAADDDPPVFVYNHRFESYKRPDLTFGLFDDLRTRYPIQVWASQTPGQMSGGSRGYHYDRSVFAPLRDDYLHNIAVPAINTINTLHETFCIALFDSITVGHLVVVPDAITFPELVPDDYPYLFKSPAEQRAMVETILSTWPQEYNKWRLRLAEHARERFGLSRYVRDYLALFSREEEKHRQVNHKPSTLRALHGAFDSMTKGKKYPALHVRNTISKIKAMGGTQSMPTRRAIREAMSIRDDIRVGWDKGVVLWRV